MKQKPILIYLHRYPIEYEMLQVPSTLSLIDTLQKKYDVVYLSMRGTSKNREMRKGIKISEIPLTIDRTNAADKMIKTALYYLYLPSILLMIKKLNPRIIWAREPLPFLPSIMLRLNIPTIVETSDWWWSVFLGKTKFGRKFAWLMERLEVKDWNNHNAIAIGHTNAELKLLNERGMSINKIKIVNAPIFSKLFFPCRADRTKIGFEKNDFVVGMQGIIQPNKGYDQVIEWWAELVKEHSNWKLLIVGGAGKEEWVKDKIREFGVENNVIMTGWLPTQKDVNRYLNAADCLLVTRRNSPDSQGIIPSSLCYCMQTGKPVVATGLPGISEVIQNGVSGFTFKPDSYKSFKDVLEYVYKNPAKMKKIGKNGMKRAKEYFGHESAIKAYSKAIDEFYAKFSAGLKVPARK